MIKRKYTSRRKYTRELLEPAVALSKSFREVLRRCNAPDLSGGTHAHIARMVRQFELDTSHFTGQGHGLGKRSSQRKAASEILIYHDDKTRNKAAQLTRALLEIGRDYKCFTEVCTLRNLSLPDEDFEPDPENGSSNSFSRFSGSVELATLLESKRITLLTPFCDILRIN